MDSSYISYKAGWDDLRRRSALQEDYIKFFRDNKARLYSQKAQTCLSYGAGCGELDKVFIETLLPGLKTYIGVEPDTNQMATLKETMSGVQSQQGKIKCEFIQECAEDYRGPPSGVDVILMFHMVYHLKDPAAFMQRCLSELTPGGTLVLICTAPGSFLDKLSNYVRMNRNVSAIKKMGEFVRETDFRKVTMHSMNHAIDYNNIGKAIVSFYLMRNASDEEIKKFTMAVENECDAGMDMIEAEIYICQR